MKEQLQYPSMIAGAITLHNLMELEYQQGLRNLDTMLCRMKDLSAYSLTHTDIFYHHEGIELLALGLFFGLTDIPPYQTNRQRLQGISQAAHDYQGKATIIEQQIDQLKP